MGYRIDVDLSNCLTCGICMDVCPVQAMDMRRPTRAGVEGQPANPWLMETPVQVGECIGCGICIRECPVEVMTLASVAGRTALAPAQGPIEAPLADGRGWIPLSAVTREALKPDHPSPFSPFHAWTTRERPAPWQVWTTMEQDAAAPMAPCQAACPAGTDAGRYVGLIAEGRYDEAYAVAGEVNPFPSVCGWICTAPCEAVCRRGVLDEPISIRTLKRFAAERGHLAPVTPPAPSARQSQRVAIVGGGPAGMASAYYLARLGYGVVVFEAMPVSGGMMAIGIPEYRLPRAALQADLDRILGLGVELRLGQVLGRDVTLGDLEREGFAAIFLATGASRSRRLEVPGGDLEGIVPATLFLKRVNLGEHPHLEGPVVVVGGGSTAMDAARSALRSGASSVTVLYRRGRDQMPAQHEEVEAAEREGVAIRAAVGVRELVGHDGRVVRVATVDRRPTGAGGAFEDVAGTEGFLPAATVLVAIGEEPDPSILPEGAGIGISGFGIAADARSLATGRAGVFAGGDVVSGAKTVIDAVAAGRRAAGSIHEFLSGTSNGEAEILHMVKVPRAAAPALSVDLSERTRVRAALPMFAPGSFAATQPGFTDQEATAEAGRCLRCDAVYGCPTVHVTARRASGSAPGPMPIQTPASAAAASAAIPGGQA